MSSKKYHTFLSHNNEDKPAIEQVAHRLRQKGIEPWLDKWNLIPGTPWQPAIEDALTVCDTCAVFIGPSGIGPWQNEEMRAAINRRVSQTKGRFRVIPVLLPGVQRPERSALPTFLVATTWVEFRRSLDDEDALNRLISGIRGIEPGPGPEQAIYEGVCPYRGLRFFDTEHAPFFFGREAITEWLVNELRSKPGTSTENRFLAIIGASGSGKSSLARAGLIPALKRGELNGSERWPIIVCRPGKDPVESLAVALATDPQVGNRITSVRNLMSDLRNDKKALHLTTRQALHHDPETSRVVVLVDQFEEIFSLCHDDSLRLALIDNLLYAAGVAQGKTVVVITMRADFYGKCASYDVLSRALSDHQTLVGNLTKDELRRAIERPAQFVGCELEAGLVETLIRDVENQAGALPLLQYALTELWERRVGCKLMLAAYEDIGRLEGALERRANEIFEGLGEDKREICRRIFLRLTQSGEGTEDIKRRALFQELLPADGNAASVHEVTQILADARLITTEGDKDQPANRYVEVAHEALIHNWDRLRGWMDEDREFLLWRQRLRAKLEEWERTEHEKGTLLRGAPLTEAERWLIDRADDISRTERDFIESSVALREQERAAVEAIERERETSRQRELAHAQNLAKEQRKRARLFRRLAAVLVVVVLLAIVATIVALHQVRVAEKAKEEAVRQERIATVRRLAAESKVLAAESRSGTSDRVAMALALEAFRRSKEHGLDMPEGEQVLRDALETDGFCILRGHTDRVRAVAFSPDNRWLVTGCDDGTARLWNLNYYCLWRDKGYGGPLVDFLPNEPIPLKGHQGGVWATAFTQDSCRLVTGGQDGTVRVWDLTAEDPSQDPIVLPGHDKGVNAMAVSPDGRRLVTAGEDGTARLWSLTAQDPSVELPVLRGHTGELCCVGISPNGRWLATGSMDRTARLWDLAAKDPTQNPFVLGGHKGGVHRLAFSPDSRQLVTIGDSSPRSWDLTAADPSVAVTVLPEGSAGSFAPVAFSSDGRWLAIASGLEARLWAVVDGGESREAVVLTRHRREIRALTFALHGHCLATGGMYGTVVLWNLTAPTPESTAVVLRSHGDLEALTVSPDGYWLVAAGGGGATLWSLRTEDLVRLASRHGRGGVLSEVEWRRYFPEEEYRKTPAGLGLLE